MTYRNPFLIQQVKSQCLQHTDSSIVCGTSADSYNKMSAASGNGVSDDFPNPVGCCIQRIPFGFGKECNSGSSGHFDDCSFASIQNAVTAKHRFSRGPVTHTCVRVPPQPSVKASTVPSPPSASGRMVISASGYMRRIPAEALSPASREVMLPLKESMAITTFMYTLLLIFDGCITMVCSTVKVIAMCKYAYNKFYSIFLRHLSV